MQPPVIGTSWRWLLVALAFIEVLTATGIMFGWSAISLALTRDGVYSELCNNSNSMLVNSTALSSGVCDAQAIRLNAVYGVAATAFPLSMFCWGPAMDRWGARGVRLSSLTLFISGSLLFALTHADGEVAVDAFTVAGGLVSAGGAGFLLSHFVIAEHFRGSAFGVVHTLLNGAMDSSTVTMVALEGAYTAGLSLRNCFLCLAGLGIFYLGLSTNRVWRGMLEPPPCDASAEEVEVVATIDLKAEQKPPAPMSQFSGSMDLSHLGVGKQLRSAHFVTLALWAVVAIFQTMFVLGTIGSQLQYNGGGRDAARVDELVRAFNWLILTSAPVGPIFGRVLDRFGSAVGFTIVVVLGILAYLGLALCANTARAEVALRLAFIGYGWFRAFNYAAMTSYIQGVFGNASFGTLYGIGIGVVAVSAAAAQSPVTAWVIGCIDDGTWVSFAPIDLTLVFASVGLLSFPVWILWMRRKSSSRSNASAETALPRADQYAAA